MNEGRRQLLAALQRTTRRALARRMGVSAMAVSRWASGERKPVRYADRDALRRELGIALDAWDRPAAGARANEPRGYTRSCMLVA